GCRRGTPAGSLRRGSSPILRAGRLEAKAGLQLVRPERALEGIAVQRVVALDADGERGVAWGTRDAQQHVAVADLAAVERATLNLIDLTLEQLRRAGDAAAVAAA